MSAVVALHPLGAIEFRVPGQVVAKGRPRVTSIAGHARAYTPTKTRHYEHQVSLFAAQAMQGRALFYGPVRLIVTVEVAPPASWSAKRVREALAGEFAPTRKPDLDNYLKAAADALDGVVWRDDAQVVEILARKVYAEAPALVVRVESLAMKPAP